MTSDDQPGEAGSDHGDLSDQSSGSSSEPKDSELATSLDSEAAALEASPKSDSSADSDLALGQVSADVRIITNEEAELLKTASSETVVKVGSPFASGTALSLDVVGQQVDFETGVWRETMLGGLFASALMVVFALPSLFFFPSGALMISALGCLLGMMALASRKPMLALAATCVNLIVLATGFAWTIGY